MIKSQIKVSLIFVFFLFVAVGLVIRSFYLQVISKDKLRAYSKSQTIREIESFSNRGNILDRNLNPLAINLSTYSIFAMPNNVKSKNDLVLLANILTGKKSEKYINKIGKRKRFTWLERQIELTKSQVDMIKKMKGIHLEKTAKRYYPNHQILSQVLGSVGVDNKGLSGIELKYDNKLRGLPSRIKYVRDAKGRAVKVETEKPAENISEIILSIDKDIQGYIQKSLIETIEKYEAIAGGVGVMDAESGEILAMANFPTYDPNNIQKEDIPKMKIPFVSDPFEPGSVFKVFTVASALENKKATKMTNYFCERGSYFVEGHQINEAESKKKYEWLSVQEILRYSSNVGTTKIAFDLGMDLLLDDLENLGVGKKTGVELPGESRGIFKYGKDSSKIRLSNLSFGQGVATTGIQILSAFSAIANGGVYKAPTIIKNGNIDNAGRRVFSKDTVSQIEEMLVDSVYNGTGGNAKIEHFQIAGKTSTAQKPSKGKGYEGYIPAFVGYPVNIDKRFVVYVYIDSPKGARYYGNLVAAPLFKKIASYIIYKDKKHFKYAIKKGNYSKNSDTVVLRHSSRKSVGNGEMPDLVGLDKKSALTILKDLDVKVRFSGIGIVHSQSIAPGVKYSRNNTLKVTLKRPIYE
jgi:cell division protein FtsI/penicillin-binding protein 2